MSAPLIDYYRFIPLREMGCSSIKRNIFNFELGLDDDHTRVAANEAERSAPLTGERR
jgi:hypothetical protein